MRNLLLLLHCSPAVQCSSRQHTGNSKLYGCLKFIVTRVCNVRLKTDRINNRRNLIDAYTARANTWSWFDLGSLSAELSVQQRRNYPAVITACEYQLTCVTSCCAALALCRVVCYVPKGAQRAPCRVIIIISIIRPMSDTQQSWANFVAQLYRLGNCQFSIGKQSSVHSIIY